MEAGHGAPAREEMNSMGHSLAGIRRRCAAWAAAVAWVGAAPLAHGASIQLQAQISDGEVTAGQDFVYQITASSQGGQADLSGLQMPDFPSLGLTVRGDTRQSTSLTQVGGNMEMQLSVGRILMAPKEGTYTIPPATWTFGGQTVQSNPVAVTVTKPSFDSLPQSFRDENILPAKSNYPSLNQQLAGRLFLRPTLSKTDPYEGEPILVAYTALSDFETNSLRLSDCLAPEMAGLQGPDFDIYTLQNIYTPPGKLGGAMPSTEIQAGGKTYQAVVVYKAYCVPKKPGPLTLGPYYVRAQIRIKRSGGSSRFPFLFDDNYADAVLPTLPLEVHVKPLPTAGRPADFDNAIGEFTIQAQVDRTSMNEDDLATLKVTISGRGHVAALGEPKLPPLDDFEIFDSKKSDEKIQGADDGLRGGKVFEYVLRAKRPGSLTIPSISFVAFDPWKAKYERLATAPMKVEVSPSNGKSLVIEHGSQPSGAGTEPAVRKLDEGLDYIQTVGFVGQGLSMPWFEDPWFLALQAAPFLLVVGAFAVRRRRDRLANDVGFARRRIAGSSAVRRLRGAAKLAGRDGDAFYAELSTALRGFFADKFNRPTSGLTTEAIVEELARRAIPDETSQAVRRLLDLCDQARFAPSSGESAAMRQALDEAGQLISSLGRRI